MGNLQGKETETSARLVAPGEGIKGDLRSAGRSRRRPGGCSEGSTNMGGDHGPGDDSRGPSEGTSGGGPRTGSAVAVARRIRVVEEEGTHRTPSGLYWNKNILRMYHGRQWVEWPTMGRIVKSSLSKIGHYKRGLKLCTKRDG